MDDQDWGVLGVLGALFVVTIDLLLFALELTFQAAMLCFTIAWGLFCLLLDMND